MIDRREKLPGLVVQTCAMSVRAAGRGCSTEEEARTILRDAVDRGKPAPEPSGVHP